MTAYHDQDFLDRLRYKSTLLRYLKLVISGWWTDRKHERARRRAAIEMAQMEEWQLRDIGLNRGDVDRLLHRHGVALDQVKSDLHS